MQEYQLKNHKLKQLLRVPPLQVLERLMFEFIWAAFILLTITIATGFYFIEDMFAQHLVHKTFFTIASWFVFAGLLLGRHIAGWRGQLAVKLTLSGFFLANARLLWQPNSTTNITLLVINDVKYV